MSDGSDSVEELANKVVKNRIEIYALTDHDTVEGCISLLNKKMNSTKFISGVEISLSYKGTHIIGLGIDPSNYNLNEYLIGLQKKRTDLLEQRISNIDRLFKLTSEDIRKIHSCGGYKKVFYDILKSKGIDFIHNKVLIEKNLNVCESIETLDSVSDAILSIKKASGISILAHPLNCNIQSKSEFLNELDNLIDIGLDGMECFYGAYCYNDCQNLEKLAISKELLISCGSDYHGANKINRLGSINSQNINIERSRITVLNCF